MEGSSSGPERDVGNGEQPRRRPRGVSPVVLRRKTYVTERQYVLHVQGAPWQQSRL
jgi:hypothetical protein